MEVVNSEKLEEVANYIGEKEMYGDCVCYNFNDSLEKNRIDVPCDIGSCEGNCPFYSEENFLKWIKPGEKQTIGISDRPNQMDFLGYDNRSNSLLNKDGYITALEKYCDSLELYIKCKDGYLEESKLKNRELANKLEKIRGVLDGSH